jgi:hypothetical protein
MTRSFTTLWRRRSASSSALARIRSGEGADAELHKVLAYLLNILELVERDRD